MRFSPKIIYSYKIAVGALVVLSVFQGPASHAQESATLQPGTVFEVYAVGTPDFRFLVPVTPSGEATFPLMDPIDVTDRTLATVREQVKTALANRVYRRRTGDGSEVMINLLPEEIVVDVAEYPPVYVTGDVRTPGAVAYHPNMSVRQAIALAGGYDRLGNSPDDLRLRAMEYRGAAEKLMLEQTALQTRREGLEAILDGAKPSGTGDAVARPPSASRDIERLQAQEEEVAAERTNIAEAVSVERARLEEIVEERALIADELEAQENSLEEVRDLYERKIAPSSRLNDELRYLSDVRERALSLSFRQAETEREIARLQQRRSALSGQQRIEFMTEMQETVMRLDAISVELRSLEERFNLAARGSMDVGDAALVPIASLFRRDGDGDRLVPAGESSLLQAGDVLEIRIPVQSLSKGRF